MKRRIIVILSLILCFMLSCDEETLDKVFVQGGMDASSPKVVVAVDPDRVEAFENGEVTSIKKESEVKSFETIKETPPVEVYSLIKEEVVLTLKEAVDSAKAEAEDDLKAYVDSLFSNEKTEIMEGVEKAKEDTILELKSIESSILSVVEENKNEILSNNEILESSFDEKSSVLEKEIESTNILLDSTIKEMEEKIEDLYAYIDSEVPALIDEAKAEIMDEVNANIALLSSNTSSVSYDEDIKEYVDSKCAEIEEEITSYIDQIEEDISSSILREVEYKLNDILNEKQSNNIYTVDPTSVKEEIVDVKVEKVVEEPTQSINGLLFKKTESGYEVVGYDVTLSSLIIPSSVHGVPVTSIADKAFKESKISGDVVLPKTIERIGDEAFMNAYSLDGKICLPSSLNTIGDRAFFGCSSLEGDLIIPDSVESIGSQAFAFCVKLGKGVYGGKGLKNIGHDVFLSSGIKNSHLPPAVSKILGL